MKGASTASPIGMCRFSSGTGADLYFSNHLFLLWFLPALLYAYVLAIIQASWCVAIVCVLDGKQWRFIQAKLISIRFLWNRVSSSVNLRSPLGTHQRHSTFLYGVGLSTGICPKSVPLQKTVARKPPMYGTWFYYARTMVIHNILYNAGLVANWEIVFIDCCVCTGGNGVFALHEKAPRRSRKFRFRQIEIETWNLEYSTVLESYSWHRSDITRQTVNT